jgi:hypothetical protein
MYTTIITTVNTARDKWVTKYVAKPITHPENLKRYNWINLDANKNKDIWNLHEQMCCKSYTDVYQVMCDSQKQKSQHIPISEQRQKALKLIYGATSM